MKVTVIGCGNLGSSFIEGLIKSELLTPSDITASDPDEEKLEKMRELRVKTTSDNQEATKRNDKIFIAVKPSLVPEVLKSLDLSEKKLIISLAAVVSTELMNNHTEARIIRVMPNICGSVKEMASAYALGPRAEKEDGEFLEMVLNNLGKTVRVEERLMDTVTGLSGSGPAFIFLVIKAMKEAGEELGLPEKDALKLAAQTVKGSGELVLKSGETLQDLIDMVSSPKGTTIEGLKVLKQAETEKNIKKAVKAAAERAEELSK
ncbi:hypothetical protein AKJ56_02135 [candidate division MSBL1 archaeon SCGC-AAA382N08]|uniref:Pyrroline-5-carboxylate reductase n=1 Tax=candidate division MSBL1 archaeon SCGC-AAA382N08 TaxID=1698285 RepID=A0A133VND0_9EURY|nr:hypothetical protein AKJ56_02135 [candidate division MSBL1 archaeon SCGC-AAA382N08]